MDFSVGSTSCVLRSLSPVKHSDTTAMCIYVEELFLLVELDQYRDS